MNMNLKHNMLILVWTVRGLSNNLIWSVNTHSPILFNKDIATSTTDS